MTDRDDMDPALWSLGMLQGDAYEAAARRAESDADFRTEAESWEARLAPLAGRLKPVAPRDHLLFEIERRIDARAVPSFHGGKTIRAEDGAWVEWAPGIRIKSLHKMPAINRQSMLLDVSPGAYYPSHLHEEDEELYVISGDLWFGDLELGPGDYHLAMKGTQHPGGTSKNGCLCVAIMDM